MHMLWLYFDLFWYQFEGLVQERRISSVLAVELSLSCIDHRVHNDFKWRIYPYPSGLLHWHWGNHMIAPVPVK